VVEIVNAEMTPVEVGLMLVGANVMVPQGRELDWHMDGLGEMDSVRATG